jgi:hypothetical protein
MKVDTLYVQKWAQEAVAGSAAPLHCDDADVAKA